MFWLMPATRCFSVLFNQPQYAIVHCNVFKFLTNYEWSTISCWNLLGICLWANMLIVAFLVKSWHL